jgi:hypothetical protein
MMVLSAEGLVVPVEVVDDEVELPGTGAGTCARAANTNTDASRAAQQEAIFFRFMVLNPCGRA